MNGREVWDEELVWREDGHVSDLVVNALGDGQDDVVPMRAIEHVDDCRLCTDRLAAWAVLSISLGQDLSEWARPEEERAGVPLAVPVYGSRPAQVPFPHALFWCALALFVLGAVPGFWALESADFSVARLGHDFFDFVRGLRIALPFVVGRASGAFFAVSLSATLLFVVGGFFVARTSSPEWAKEGVS